VLRAFLKKMYFCPPILSSYLIFPISRAKRRQRQGEKFESIDRATDKKKRSIRRFDVLRVWRSLSFLAAVKERKFERREKASSMSKRDINTRTRPRMIFR
tara:strand:+ start:459 stop:758 length:300 start_codon:yes stop_codon:yes gene_type:complete